MSEIDWFKIQRKLEGRCHVCSGLLPDHFGICPVRGEEILEEYRRIDEGVGEISKAVKKLLKRYPKDV